MAMRRRSPIVQAAVVASAAFGPFAYALSAPAGDVTLMSNGVTGTWDPSSDAPVVDASRKLCLRKASAGVDARVIAVALVTATTQQISGPVKLAANLPGQHNWTREEWLQGDLCSTLASGKYYTFAVTYKGASDLHPLSAMAVLSMDSPPPGGASAPPSTSSNPSALASTPPAAGVPPTDSATIAAVVSAARAMARHHEVAREGIGAVGAKVTLMFLPDGQPVEPLPKDLTERDDIKLILLQMLN